MTSSKRSQHLFNRPRLWISTEHFKTIVSVSRWFSLICWIRTL